MNRNRATTSATITEQEYARTTPYAMTIHWDERSDIFVAGFPDVPGCRSHGATREEAARNAEAALAFVLAALADVGTPAPEPRDALDTLNQSLR